MQVGGTLHLGPVDRPRKALDMHGIREWRRAVKEQTKSFFANLFFWALLLILLFVAAAVLSGCCTFSKRSCFPDCPSVAVEVQIPCKLPPLPTDLPVVTRIELGCPAPWACYDTANAARLAVRVGKLMDWIVDARALCGGSGASRPASQPASKDAK